jgi:hypothetical protein
MPNTLTAEQIRELTLTLLLIERDLGNEKMAELTFGQMKSPAIKRGELPELSMQLSNVDLIGSFQRVAS